MSDDKRASMPKVSQNNRGLTWRLSTHSELYELKGFKPIPLRPALNYKDIPLPDGEVILRLERYRTLNRWYVRPFKGKYNDHLFALTKSAIYDITQEVTT